MSGTAGGQMLWPANPRPQRLEGRDDVLRRAGTTLQQVAEWMGCDLDVVEFATRAGVAVGGWSPRPSGGFELALWEVQQGVSYVLGDLKKVKSKLERPERASFWVELTPSGWALFGDDGLSVQRWRLSRIGGDGRYSRHRRRAEIEALIRSAACAH